MGARCCLRNLFRIVPSLWSITSSEHFRLSQGIAERLGGTLTLRPAGATDGPPPRAQPSSSRSPAQSTQHLLLPRKPARHSSLFVVSQAELSAEAGSSSRQAGPSANYHVESLFQRRTRRARSVFQRLALPTPVS